MCAVTGLSAAAVGIVGDGAHQHTGGYHEGVDVLVQIGRYTPPAQWHVGSSTQDYSARLLRDRLGLTVRASATDVDHAWPNGGDAAWLRWNRALAAALPRDAELAAVRAINYSPDGRVKLRFDREHGWVAGESTTDTVLTHTHVEFYRDTSGGPLRARSIDRLIALASAAIAGPARLHPIEETMWQGQLAAGTGTAIVATPWDKSVISFGATMGKAKLRVAEHTVNQPADKAWSITEIVVSDADPHRTDLPAREGVDRRDITRVPVDANDTLSAPVVWLAWLA